MRAFAFGYDVPDSQLTTKIGYVAEKVERWNPLVEEGEEVTGPTLKAGLLVGDEILAVDGGYVENFMDIQNRIVTGKQQTAQERRLVNLTVLRDGKEIKIKVYPRGSRKRGDSGYWHRSTRDIFHRIS